MTRHEREQFEAADPTTKFRWRINLHQLNKLIDELVEYDHLMRIRRGRDFTLSPQCVVWYTEPFEDYSLNIYVEQTPRRGKFSMTVSRGLLPLIRDILGAKFPPGEEVF